MAETGLAQRGDRLLKRRGAYFVNVHGTVAGDTGTPDRIVCYRGVFLAIEWKTARGWISVKQRWHLERIQRAGGRAIVATSTEDLAVALRRIDADLDHHLVR